MFGMIVDPLMLNGKRPAEAVFRDSTGWANLRLS
jgi:hypothetical protein